ncbi:MAG: ATP-binding protein [Cellvibrionaceae bacterium]
MANSGSAVTHTDNRSRSSDSGAATVFFRLADMLAGPVTPTMLRKALRTCLDLLEVEGLNLFATFPNGDLACLISANADQQHIYFNQDRVTAPSATADFITGNRSLEQIRCDSTSATALKCRSRDLLLASLPAPGEIQGLLVLEKAPDLSPRYLCDIGELLFAATNHCINDSNSRAMADNLGDILNFSDSIYTSWNEKAGWQYHNVNGLVQLGYRKKDLNLRSLEAHNPMHPDDWHEAYRLFNSTLQKGTGHEHEYRAVGQNGETHWYHYDVTVTEKNEQGGAREFVSISRNITTVRATAKAAVERANREKWLVAKAKAIFSCNDFESLNEILREVGSYLGVDRCTVRVVDPETLYCNLVAEWHKPGLEAIADMFPDVTSQTGTGWIGRLIALGETYVVNSFRAEVPSKKILAYHRAINTDACVTQPMIYGHELTGYLAILNEQPRQWTDADRRVAKEIADAIHMTILRNRLLDELRATDERFKLAMENSTHGLWDHDAVNRTIYYSPHFYEMLGYPRQDHPIPIERMLDYIDPVDHHVLFETSKRQYKAGQKEVYMELRHRKRDGSVVWILARGQVVKQDDRGRPLRVVGVNMDITKQKETLAELRQARERADVANRSKSIFLERMSHEIRTPMNAIIGMSYLTLGTALNQDQQMYLQDIDDAAKSLLHIIDDILDFSKIEAGELTIVDERFNLKRELQRIVNLMSVRAAQAQNQLNHTIDDDVPEHVVGDKHRLGQILINLLGNAIKFTKQGTVSLAVHCSELDPRINSVTLQFSVKDSGIGLSDTQIATLYEPFVQAEGSTARKYGGTGLGLSISKHLVEMMGGSIRCTSSVDVGTTFAFTIVFKQQQMLDAIGGHGTAEPWHDPALPKRAPFTQRRVLLAEDNPVNQRVAKGILARIGIETVTAVNGQEAIDLLYEAGPGVFDAVLMDIEMPVLDGLAATRAIRLQEHFHNLPIVAMTAHAMMGDRERCLAAGMDDHIPKPVNPETVLQVLSRVLGEDQWLDQDLGKHQARE